MLGQHLLRIKIRFFRITRGLTQSEISSQLGLSLRTYQRLENGSGPLDVQTLMLISQIFNISFYELSNPEVKKEELQQVEFFRESEDLFAHADLSQETAIKIRKLVKQTKLGQLPIEEIERLEEFRANPLPLFFTDLKKTMTNAAFRNSSSSEFHTTLNHWKASEFCLKNPYMGFHYSHHYTVVLSPKDLPSSSQNPILFGFRKNGEPLKMEHLR
ncbi:MAG: helix-turn-helix domain-containing protein [Halobacteriovoraceae bacterium]|nr:helix-turn-helix domain-containing protein [Halobacteriovoraceae bacterium]